MTTKCSFKHCENWDLATEPMLLNFEQTWKINLSVWRTQTCARAVYSKFQHSVFLPNTKPKWSVIPIRKRIQISSSSSSGGTPSGEHSRLYNWTPFGTILCAKPCTPSWGQGWSVAGQTRWPLRRRQSVGRRLMAAWRAREWSCGGSARAICPNRRNRLDKMVQVTGGCPSCASLPHL